jgi:hypothetical protein
VTDVPSASDVDERSLLRRGVLREAARASDSYGLLLLLILIDYVLLSLGGTSGWDMIFKAVFVGLTALLGFHTSHVRGRLLLLVRIAVVVAVLASIGVAAHGAVTHDTSAVTLRHLQGIVGMILGLLVLTTPIAVLSRIVQHKQVTSETLLGAICVYVLLGLVFSYFDFSLYLATGHFFAQPTPAPPGWKTPDFLYFSFITMTTVGYGDLTPTVGLPRTMAVMEALAGQIFLVVMVSRLVAMYSPRERGERRRTLLRAGADGADDAPVADPEAVIDHEGGFEGPMG